MKQRGKRSTASLSVVPFAAAPIEPSGDLSDEESRIFREIAATKPADYFTNENRAQLTDLARAVVAGNRISKLLNSKESEKFSPAELDRYLSMREKQARLSASLATKLRLTPQSKYQANTAARIPVANSPQIQKPWLASAK